MKTHTFLTPVFFLVLSATAGISANALETETAAPLCDTATDVAHACAGPVVREGDRFVVEGFANRSDDKACIYAASRAFVAALRACNAAQYANCDGTRPEYLEQNTDFCHVRSVVTGSR